MPVIIHCPQLSALFEIAPTKFQKLVAELAEKEKAHTEAEEQWLELEMLREELEGG